MKNTMRALILAASICGARQASAGYVEYVIHGNSCVSTTAGLTPVYTQYGPYNGSTTTAMMLTCPVPVPNNTYYDGYIQVFGWTRNTGDMVFCNFGGTDAYGNNAAFVQGKVPYNGGSYSFGGGDLYLNGNGTSMLYVTCHIPNATANGRSYLSSIYILADY